MTWYVIATFERHNYLPRAREEVSSAFDRRAAIRGALEAAGVVFVDEDGGGPGVRLRKGVL